MVYKIQGGIKQVDNEFVFPWLTQTPTPFPPTLEVVLAEEATATAPAPNPTATKALRVEAPEATPASAPQRSSPICGSAAFLPLVAIVWFARKRR
jgi:hypothetical protein